MTQIEGHGLDQLAAKTAVFQCWQPATSTVIRAIRDSSVEHNAAGSGGGFSATGVVDLVLHGAAILFNTADAGGGGYVAGGSLLVRNSTISGDKSKGDGGGLLLSVANSAHGPYSCRTCRAESVFSDPAL